MNTNAKQYVTRANFETLESREYMSAATIGLQDGVLTLTADPNTASTIEVAFSANHKYVTATATDKHETFRVNQIKSLVLIGSTKNDYIYVDPKLGLPAEINGNGGNDIIWGGTGLDTINGGNGNDQIHGHGAISTGSGNDTVWGSNLGDSIYAGSGSDLVIGGNGNNLIYGGSGNDTLISGTGNDKILAGSGNTVIYGGSGNDTLSDGTGSDTIYGGSGPNVIIVKSPTTVIHANAANDVEIEYIKPISSSVSSTSTNVSGTATLGATPKSATRPTRSPGGSTSPASPIPTAAPTVPNPAAPQPVITQLETTIIAGEGVNVNALSSVIPTGTPLTTTYSWNFGDVGSKYNVLPGWNAGHVYANAGTYTITLTETDSAGNISSTSSKVIVTADTRPIIYVDNSGSDSNSGASPSQAVQTAAEAFKLAGSNVKIEFKAGETFVVNADLFISGHDVYVGSYGTGSSPVLMWEGANPWNATICMATTASNVTIQGLTFDSPNGVVNGEAPEVNDIAIWAAGTNLVVSDNTFLNVDDAVNATLMPTGVIVQDNTAPLLQGLRGYFCWVDGTNWSIMGNTVANTTRQHDIRGNDTAIVGVLIYDNNLTKQYPASDPDETAKSTINFREGNYVYIDANVLNDSMLAFFPGPGQATNLDVDWVVVENNVLHDAELSISTIVHHMLVSNNTFDLSGEGNAQIDIQPGDLTDPDGHLTDITITQNTGINTGTNGEFLLLESQAAPGSITLTKNLYEAPNDELGLNGAAALWIDAPDLSGFAQISGNIWPAPVTNGQGVAGVVNYINGYASSSSYLTPQEWDSESDVSNDQFSDTPLAAGTYQIKLNGITAGANGIALAA